jgi:hypothetical protein
MEFSIEGAFFNSIMRGDVPSVKSILNDSTDINHCIINAQDGTAPPIVIASKYARSVKMLEVLLDGGCTVDAKDDCGGTALMVCAIEGDVECVKLLLDRGAKIDTEMTLPGIHRPITPFMCAIWSKSVELMDILKPTSIDIIGISATLEEARNIGMGLGF